MEIIPQISIVVPVYNSENFLNKCIESILNQSFKNFELILVDDGSTDSSSLICDKWAEKDNRIICIHKANGGVVDARNTGIRRARAKYLAFSDNDDWADKYFLETMYTVMVEESADMTQCNYARVIGEKLELKAFPPQKIKRDYIHNVLLQRLARGDDVGISHTKWNKMFVTEKIQKCISLCNEKTALCEDWLLILSYIGLCDKIICLDTKPLYFFRYNYKSVTASYRPGYKENYDLIYYDAARILEHYGIYNVSFEDHKYFSFVWCIYGCIISNMPFKDKKREIKQILNSLDRKKLKEVIDVYPSVAVRTITKSVYYGFVDITIIASQIALSILKIFMDHKNSL